ncbi:hypothetical protein M1563_02905 [Patescibacteria group bacterium]|nr:hypothetical protein [Patescibacteria group bacterium]
MFWYFLAGFMMWNSVPHLVTGIAGQQHMTPFSRMSSAATNVVWGFVNLLIGLFLLGVASGQPGIVMPWDANLTGGNLWAFIIGAISLGLIAAWLFGRPNAHLPWQK